MSTLHSDISEVLLSADKFRELFCAIQDVYSKVEKVNNAVLKVDTILGTALHDSVKEKKRLAEL
jgi:hypothetical protein